MLILLVINNVAMLMLNVGYHSFKIKLVFFYLHTNIIECIEELTQYIISILNITFCIVKGNDLLNIFEKKINVIQIAIFLGIPINESFLKELLKTYV